MARTYRPFVVAAFLASAAFLAPNALRADVPPPAPQKPPAVEPAPNPPPTPPASEEAPDTDPSHLAILKAVDEVREEVAKNRGLAWKTKVPAAVLTRKQLRERLEAMMKEDFDAKKYEVGVRIARRLGMLTDEQDPIEISKGFLEIGVAGFFDPKTKHFYVIEGLSPDASRPTIVHELTHALDDQYFDLKDRLEAVKEDGDKGFAITCVIEGCAEHARLMYQKDHPDIAKMYEAESRKQGPAQMKALQGQPASLVLPTLLHYQLGPAFVDAAIGSDYVGGMARLFKDPPSTQEQVMHPKKFTGADRDLPRKIVWGGDVAKTLGEGWTKLLAGSGGEMTGELDFSFWLDAHLGSTKGALNFLEMAQGHLVAPQAKKAAQGWDGIWMDAYEKKGLPLGLTFASAWDTAKDADEAADAIVAALSKQYEGKWSATAWAKGDDSRSISWTGANGMGGMTVKGDTVVMADGFTADDATKVLDVLLKTTYARDAKDTYSEGAGGDALAGAAWKDEKHGVGWKAPNDAWTVVPGDVKNPNRCTLKKGTTSLTVEVRGGGLMAVASREIPMIMRSAKGFDPQRDSTEEDVGGKHWVTLRYNVQPKPEAPAVHHVLYLIGFESGAVVASLEGSDDLTAAAKDAVEGLGGLVYRE